MYKSFVKRFLDIVISFFALIILSPLFLAIIILLSIVNKGKPFFLQTRPGKNEKLFNVIKFKTMTDEREGDEELLPDAGRITKIGKFFRKTSLDEIPQLINVLKGDMSLVGPRPLLVQYLPLYSAEQKRRHEVRPGITGWAQVNGRNAISWKQKFEYDVWYVDYLSFSLDLKIIWLTTLKVIKSEGISQKGGATMEFFNGTR